MDLITSIIYIILFIILMVFVFTIGMLKQYMPRREVLLVLLVAFLIGSIGGAFFLDPIHDELPVLINVVEKNINENNETLYLDFSSSVDIDKLKKTLSKTDGFISFDENAISIPMWTFNEKEHSPLHPDIPTFSLSHL